MPAAYDKYDYPSYWVGREYEHKCEIIALKSFLLKVKRVKNILEIGAGFGRLIPCYIYRGKNVYITDPSSKLLHVARGNFKRKGVKIIHSGIDNILTKVKKKSIDLVIMVRVIHHIDDIEKALDIVKDMTSPHGYLILEFPNKGNFKNTVKEILKGNLLYSMDLDIVDKRSRKNIIKHTIAFNNFHPDYIIEKLNERGYEIIEKRSVSNLRGSWLKSIFPLDFILSLSDIFQVLLGYINFGPSIFILARKTD